MTLQSPSHNSLPLNVNTELLINKILGWISIASIAILAIQSLRFITASGDILEYDASNTLNIAARSTSEILSLVSHEQNFSTYYLLIHAVVYLTGSTSAAILLLNWLPWLIAILAFYYSLPEAPTGIRKLFTFVFAASATLYYSFFPRPYALVLLCASILGYSLSQAKLSKSTHLLLEALAVLGAVSVHPIGIFLTMPLLAEIIRPSREDLELGRSFRVARAVLAFCALVVWILFLATKGNPFDTLVRGVSYIEGTTPLQLLGNVFFYKSAEGNSITLSLMLTLPILSATLAYIFRSQNTSALVILPFTAVALAVITRVTPHHWIALSAFGITLSLFYAYQLVEHALFRVWIIIVLGTISWTCAYQLLNGEQMWRDYRATLCSTVAGYSDLPLLTDFFLLNQVSACLESEPQKPTILFDEGGFSLSTRKTSKELIELQARRGGYIVLCDDAIEERVGERAITSLPNFSMISKKLEGEDRLLLVNWAHGLVPAYQQRILDALGFSQMETPTMDGVFIFRRQGKNASTGLRGR